MERDFMKKGQATIEFLLIIVIMLMYVSTTVLPNSDSSSNATEDVVNIGKLALSAEKLRNGIQYVSISGEDTKQTIHVIIPAESTLECGTQEIIITYNAKSSGIDECSSGICTKSIKTGTDFTCDPTTLNGGSLGFTQKAIISKSATTDVAFQRT